MKLVKARAGLVLALTLVLVLTGLGPVMGVTLDEQLKQKQEEKQQLNNQISKYQDEEEDLKKSIDDTNTKISGAKSKLEDLNKQLAAANAQVSSAEKELKDAENQLAERTDTLQKRMRGVYEEGQVSYLEILFQSTGLSDFVNRLEYLGKILSNDQRLVKEISQHKDSIAGKRDELVKKRDGVVQVKAQQDREQAVLTSQEATLQVQLKKKQDMLDDLWQELRSNEQEEQKIRDLIRQSQLQNTPARSGTGALVWPAPASRSISSKFGYRYHPVLKVTRLHAGIDIPVPTGSQIVAAEDGVVIYAGEMGGYGYVVIVNHAGGLQTVYAHLSRFAVGVGNQVKAGQTIAYSGGAPGTPGAGTSTGPHLHFETRVNGVPEDPLLHL